MSTYTVGTPPNDVEFSLTESAPGTIVRLRSDNEAVIALIGYDGISFNPGISLTLAQALADTIFGQL